MSLVYTIMNHVYTRASPVYTRFEFCHGPKQPIFNQQIYFS